MTFYDISSLINFLNELALSKEYAFRGYGKQDQLYPNIIRDADLTDKEHDLLKKFEKYGSHYFQANTAIDFMSYAQHFGLPTRLLDFTYNPFIALYFSLYMPKNNNYKNSNDREFYYIRYLNLDDNIVISEYPLSNDIYNIPLTRTNSLAVKSMQTIDSIETTFNDLNHNSNLNSIANSLVSDFKIDSIKIIKKKITDRRILLVDPNQSNQRIIMQQGLFMFPYTLDKNDHITIIQNNTRVIKISKKLRDELLIYLDTLGFNAFRLMPDLASICTAVTQQVKNDRRKSSKLFKSISNNLIS